MAAFNSKGRQEKLAIVVHVIQKAYDFVILRCCSTEEGKEMYKVSKFIYSESEDIVISISGC